MAEYLHLYTEDVDGNTDIDHDLRGSTYQIDDGWTPATIDPGVDLDTAVASENMTLNILGCADAAAVADAINALRQVLWEATRRHELERYPHTRTYLRRYPDGGSAADYRTAEVVGGAVERVLFIGQREVCAGTAEYVGLVQVRVDHRCPLGVVETLQNLVPNESFEYDTDDDGLANDWTEQDSFDGGANQTPSIVAVDNTYGAYGQQLELVDAANWTGVCSGEIAVTPSVEITLKAWVDPSASTTDFKVEVYDDDLVRQVTLTWTGGDAASQKSANFTMSTYTPVKIYCWWEAGASGDVVVVDGIYLGLKGTNAPQGWASYYSIQNHEDGDDNSADHNWVHVADIPGDVDAIVENKLTLNGDLAQESLQTFIAARRTDEAIWERSLWLQAEDGALGANATLDTDADASGPAANNCVDLTTAAAGIYRTVCTWTLTDADMLRALRGVYRAYVLTKTITRSGTVTARFYTTTGSTVYTEEFTLETGTAAVFFLTPGPVLHLPPSPPLEGYDLTYWALTLQLTSPDAPEIRTDAVVLVPLDEELAYMEKRLTAMTADSDYLLMSGLNDGEAFYYNAVDARLYCTLPIEGAVVHATPEFPQRFYYLLGTRNALAEWPIWSKADDSEIELSYRPRYLSL